MIHAMLLPVERAALALTLGGYDDHWWRFRNRTIYDKPSASNPNPIKSQLPGSGTLTGVLALAVLAVVRIVNTERPNLFIVPSIQLKTIRTVRDVGRLMIFCTP